jgi:hypothetical protein
MNSLKGGAKRYAKYKLQDCLRKIFYHQHKSALAWYLQASLAALVFNPQTEESNKEQYNTNQKYSKKPPLK